MSGPPPKRPALSLYADLLGSNSDAESSNFSSAPVKYRADGEEAAAKKRDASLKFQPIKRPQVQPKRTATAASSSFSSSSAVSATHKLPSGTAPAVTSSSPDKQPPSSTPLPPQPGGQRTNFEDWVGDEDEDIYYQERQKHERGGRKKGKKKKKAQQEARSWDWDDVYDPTLPNSYADYKGSEEQMREIRDWKARLYYHQLKETKKQVRNGTAQSDDEEGQTTARPMNRMFAPPPSNLSFAPPSFDDNARPPVAVEDDEDDRGSRMAGRSDARDDEDELPRPSFAQRASEDDATGDEAYMRRTRMSGMAFDRAVPSPPPPPPPPSAPPANTSKGAAGKPDIDIEAKRAEAQAKIAAFKAKLGKPPSNSPPAFTPAATPKQNIQERSSVSEPQPPPPPSSLSPVEQSGVIISGAPVRYDNPRPPPEIPLDEEDQEMEENDSADVAQDAPEPPRSNRPGQKGFAERLLKKYGWERGQGLGAQGDGITTAIVAKAEKRKKKSDAAGGGWAAPANMGKIVGGKRRKPDPDDASAANGSETANAGGVPSHVVCLDGMLAGLDIDRELRENNLLQEIGDEMTGRYGTVERVFVWRPDDDDGDGGSGGGGGGGGEAKVFIKFTNPLSALRAVNNSAAAAGDDDTFAGNAFVARFFDADKFERGEYI